MRNFENVFLFLMVLICIPIYGTTSIIETESAMFNFYQEQDSIRPSKTSKDPFINRLNSKTSRHNAHNPIEKVFLHTDKSMFAMGETIWYSAYVVIGPLHRYTDGSKVVHVDLIAPDGEIAVSLTHALINGKGSGALKLPNHLPEGNYQLRSYTRWMQNYDSDFFFTKELSVVNTKNKRDVSLAVEDRIDLQFFPEGGHMVADLAGKVSFKAIGSDGLPRKVSGKVLNSSGGMVATLGTFDRGSGFFQMIPKKGERYAAELDDGSQYPLPEILDVGYTISVNNLSEKGISVFVQASEELRDKPFYVVGHIRQRNYFHSKFEFDRDQTLKFEVPKADMPGGVLTLTLFDLYNKPWCERPIFTNHKEGLVISTKINTNKFVKRGKVALDINVTDHEGKPIATNLSLATTDAGQVKKDLGASTILSHILLESDIKGDIVDPGLLFKDRNQRAIEKIDLVMLTNGWRKYHWPEVWKDVKPTKEFPFAEGLTVSGKAFSTNEKHMPNATLNIMAKAGEKLGVFSAKTDLDGRFSIPDFNFNGEAKVVFNAYSYKDKTVDLKVSLDPHRMKVPAAQFKSPPLRQNEEAEDYGTHSLARSRMEALYETQVTKLDEVVVTEKKKKESRNQSPSTLGMDADATLYTEDHIAFHTVLQLLSLFNGVTVSGRNVSIRRGGAPLFVLDGRPLANEGTSSGFANVAAGGNVPKLIETMDTFTVERVELLKTSRAAIWGARAGNGVILIYTKRGEGVTYDAVLSPDFTISGHAAEKEFYSPKYNVKKEVHRASDYRATLYWHPSIVTDENGNAKIEFFSSDSAKEIQVSIESLSKSGVPGTYLETFGAEKGSIR